MASLTPGISVAVFTFWWICVLTEQDQQITVKTEDNVTLQCLDHRGGDIELLEWTRLNPKEDVFVWKNGKNECCIPHPSFKNRVELRDPEMKDGDVSVILKNVTINDTGTYECYVRNTLLQLITNVTLTVTDQQITVKTGHDVTLQCLDHRGGDIELLEWRRQDLEENIFVWKHGKMSEDPQHPSFKNRVELRDPEMKDGNVSVILKNVNINDTGTYECYVRNSNTQAPPQLINSTNLIVTDSVKSVQPGEDVLLPCQGPRGADIVFVKWIRPDLESEGSVFFFRDNHTYENYQHPSFKNRVELRDPQMKDGNVSVILKNFNINDTGTYECYVSNQTPTPQLITNVTLTVTDSGGHTEDGGNKDGLVGLVVGSLVCLVLFIGIVYVIYRLCSSS